VVVTEPVTPERESFEEVAAGPFSFVKEERSTHWSDVFWHPKNKIARSVEGERDGDGDIDVEGEGGV
jgi:hypothetical protein